MSVSGSHGDGFCTHGRPGEQVNPEVGVDALDIVEDSEDFGGSLVDVELVQRGVLPSVVVGVR